MPLAAPGCASERALKRGSNRATHVSQLIADRFIIAPWCDSYWLQPWGGRQPVALPLQRESPIRSLTCQIPAALHPKRTSVSNQRPHDARIPRRLSMHEEQLARTCQDHRAPGLSVLTPPKRPEPSIMLIDLRKATLLKSRPFQLVPPCALPPLLHKRRDGWSSKRTDCTFYRAGNRCS